MEEFARFCDDHARQGNDAIKKRNIDGVVEVSEVQEEELYDELVA